MEGLDLFQGIVLLLRAGEEKAERKNPKILVQESQRFGNSWETEVKAVYLCYCIF